MSELRADIDRHEAVLLTLIRGLREVEDLQRQHSEAIFELAAALRETGTGIEVLPSTVPVSQNADSLRA